MFTIFVVEFPASTEMVWVEMGRREGSRPENSRLRGMMNVSEEYGFYHICTDGNALPWLFKDDEDFIAGINRIGICKHITGVEVISFILMDNHLHKLLYGTMAMCKEYVNKYKTLTGKWNSRKYGSRKSLKELPVTIIPVRTEEYLLETIAYIDRNPIVAGYCHLPSEYPWGSARYMFRENPDKHLEWKMLGDFSAKEIRDILKTRIRLPEDWKIDSKGMIDPQHFIGINKANAIFKSPIRYLYFLSRKLEGKIDMDTAQGNRTFIPDKELRPIVARMSESLFQTADIRSLNVNNRLMLARKLRYEYASSTKQISRMVFIDPDLLKGFV